MTEIEMTQHERESLEAHVDLCQMRYQYLAQRLSTLEVKVDSIAQTIAQNNNSLRTVIITTGGSIVAGLLGLITTIIMKF